MTKTFSWSYSKFKNFDTCPKRHYEVDIEKNFTETSEQLTWGNEVHKALANALTTGEPLPDTMKEYQHWVDEMTGAPGVLEGELVVELQLAMTKDFRPTHWKDWDGAWFRGVCDVARIDGPVAIARDWKTGKLLDDSRQLMLMAQLLFVHYPELQQIKTEFVWLKHDCVTGEMFYRDRICREWPPVLTQVREMEKAAATMDYPPKPSGLCARFCPVVSCQFHGKRR